MKYNWKHLCIGILFAGALTSCDLDTAPTTSFSGNPVETTDYADRLLAGLWSYQFQTVWSYASPGLGGLLLNDDFAGSDAVKGVSYGFKDSYNLTFGYSRGQYNSLMWDLMYDGINNANRILKYIGTASGSDKDKQRIEGQAYAARGFFYLMLASHYSFAIDKDPNAVCVPIYTEPTESTQQALTGKPASSVTEVYNQALGDLKKGVELIPADYLHSASVGADQYKIDHVVAMGLLARASLYARKWQDAYDYAGKVLEINDYLMTETEYKSGFNKVNKEWLWSYVPNEPMSDDNLASSVFEFKDATTPNEYNSLCVDPNFIKNFEDGDYRKDLLDGTYSRISQAGALVYQVNTKFLINDQSTYMCDIDFMRVSEMYLIKAEAAARLGKDGEAQQLLQKLRDARMSGGKTAATVTATGDALIKEIWMERRKELWGEGFALTDIIRNQQSVERKISNVVVPESQVNRIPEDKKDGKDKTVEGHYTIQFPDGSPFAPNSKYYLYRIPESEELQNPDLYSKYPKLDFYR